MWISFLSKPCTNIWLKIFKEETMFFLCCFLIVFILGVKVIFTWFVSMVVLSITVMVYTLKRSTTVMTLCQKGDGNINRRCLNGFTFIILGIEMRISVSGYHLSFSKLSNDILLKASQPLLSWLCRDKHHNLNIRFIPVVLSVNHFVNHNNLRIHNT